MISSLSSLLSIGVHRWKRLNELAAVERTRQLRHDLEFGDIQWIKINIRIQVLLKIMPSLKEVGDWGRREIGPVRNNRS